MHICHRDPLQWKKKQSVYIIILNVESASCNIDDNELSVEFFYIVQWNKPFKIIEYALYSCHRDPLHWKKKQPEYIFISNVKSASCNIDNNKLSVEFFYIVQ